MPTIARYAIENISSEFDLKGAIFRVCLYCSSKATHKPVVCFPRLQLPPGSTVPRKLVPQLTASGTMSLPVSLSGSLSLSLSPVSSAATPIEVFAQQRGHLRRYMTASAMHIPWKQWPHPRAKI